MRLKTESFAGGGRWSVRLLALLAAAVATSPGAAPAADRSDDVLRSPVRVTAGGSNQFMGVLSPDGRSLYYASDRGATTEIFRADPTGGNPRLLFDRNASVTWPRPSPDGKRLLYISFRSDATGDVCVLDLAESGHTCVTGNGTSDVQAFWFPDGRSIGVVQRTGLHGDYRLLRVPAGGGPASTLVDRSLSAPALSPDGRWLAYVPTERGATEVGISFAARVGRGIELRRLSDGRTVSFLPDLPGASGFPSFSPDGRWIYFTQYLNDTTFDGVIDGSDNGVLFRTSFDGLQETPAATGIPTQLTSARLNCQYPMPAADRLVMTCSRDGTLDIYTLPLEGQVPGAWNSARIDEEIRSARDVWDRILLYGRAVTAEADPAMRLQVLRRISRRHAELREYESARFYATAVQRSAAAGTFEAEWAAITLEMTAHREAENRLIRGQQSEAFLASERDRLARLNAMTPRSPDAVALRALAVTEVLGNVGDKGAARSALSGFDVGRVADRLVLLEAGRIAADLFDLLGERDALLSLYAALSCNPAIDPVDRFHFADRYVDVLGRGQSRAERGRRIADALPRAPVGSELAFRLELETRLADLGTKDPEEVRKGIFEMYRGTTDPDRRKALVLVTAQRAAAADQEFVLYEFSNSWVSWLKRESSERRYAEALYRSVVVERAYAKLAAGNLPDARGNFWGATLQTDDLESHAAFIEAAIAEGRATVRQDYEKRFKDRPDDPVWSFAQAYFLARDLPAEQDAAAFASAADQALAHLDRTDAGMPNAWPASLLRGFVEHQRWLRTGSADAAANALNRYLLAIDLGRDNPRALATLHFQAARLQAGIGNDAAALRHLAARERLPFASPEAELSFRMLRASCQFRLDRDRDADATADEALALVDGTDALARYRPLVLDRAALYALAAGNADKALELYAKLRPLVAASQAPEAGVNRLKLEVAEGSAALAAGKADVALKDFAAARALLTSMPEGLAPEPARSADVAPEPRVFARSDYLALLPALEAHALRMQDKFSEAAAAMHARRDALQARLKRLDLDEDLLDLASANYHLAEYAWRAKDADEAARSVDAGLKAAARFSERTGTPVTEEGLRLLQAGAELHLYGGIPLSRFSTDLRAGLAAATTEMARRPNPRRSGDRFLLGLYRGLIEAAPSGER